MPTVTVHGYNRWWLEKSASSSPQSHSRRYCDEKERTSEVRKTIKNFADEIPESSSADLTAALCNAGFNLQQTLFMIRVAPTR